MTTIASLNYGPMRRPEEKRPAKGSSDPIGFIMAAYGQWQPVAEAAGKFFNDKRGMGNSWTGEENFEFEIADSLLSEAKHMLSYSEPALRDATAEMLEGISEQIQPTDASGLFVSALHNLSNVSEIRINTSHKVIAYRLGQGKSVVIAPNVEAMYAGMLSAGTVINYGQLKSLSAVSNRGALSVNYYGIVKEFGYNTFDSSLFNLGECEIFGARPTDSNLVNLGNVSDSMGFCIGGTLCLNLGSAKDFTMDASETSNSGKASYANFGAINGLRYDYGEILDSSGNSQHFDAALPRRAEAIGQLKAIISEPFIPIKNAVTLEDALGAMRQVDWKGMREKITGIADKLGAR